MFPANNQLNVVLICGVTDMRKSIDGLSLIVSCLLELEPCSDQLFVFCNRQRNKLKILQWSGNGFWLHYRRLEQDTFKWPGIDDAHLSLTISGRQLNWLLDGLPLRSEQAHAALSYYYNEC